ncbi:hypothetical protein R6Q59_002264 [Mikania micrantha]|uniref:Uncharacterized protein n=1 Tax=Mikania micrantha TaxID=192012 RepID=A0A5N6NP71_9ASTR|nr:hypothetical protein E3N88_19315 [Mikania micrantha]
MRCKKHSNDPSSITGVCASCLRERLLKVIIAQEQAEAQSLAQNDCSSITNPSLPAVVSPCINRRKSNNSVDSVVGFQRPYIKPRLNHSLSDQRFYNSPHIAINTGSCIGRNSSNKKKQSLIRFSSFSNLFRSSGRDGDADSTHRVSVSTSGEPSGAGGKPTSVTSSPLWFSNALPGPGSRQKNKAVNVNECSTFASAGVVRKQRCVRNRGMSPVRASNDGEGEFSDGSSGYESAESFKQTPKKTPSHPTVRRRGGERSVSELIFCLSPLVRASPNRLWKMKGKPPVDGGFSGDTRPPVAPHLSDAKSFCANRSRKLADYGRTRRNR